MPRYVITNPTKTEVKLPDPLNGTVKPQSVLIVETQAVNFDTPAMQALLRKGVLRMNITTETPLISDHIEIPVVDMLGGGGTGNLTFKGPWAALTPYLANDLVQYGDQSWVALAPNTGVPPMLGSPFWTPLSTSLIWRGTWTVLTTYAAYDVVVYGDTTWVALAPSVGVTPVAGPFWAPMSSGMSVVQHEALDTLVHALNETHEEVPTFNADGVITTIVAQGVGGGTLIRDVDNLTADADGLITGYRVRQRDGTGMVVQTLTGAVTNTGSIPQTNVVTKT